MATKMGIRQLRDGLTATIRRVERGETIEVTHHGRPVALLTPVPSDRIARLVASGDVSAAAPTGGPRRRHPVTGAMSASQALEADRSEP